MKDTQQRIEKLEEDLKKYQEIANRDHARNATLKDAYEDSDIPPYALSLLAFEEFADLGEYDEPISARTEDGRIRSKAEIKFLKGMEKTAKVAGYIVGGFTAAAAAVVTTPISLPHLGYIAGKSAINANYNKRIEKAKIKVAKIQKELAELKKEQEQEQENTQPNA